MLNTVIRANLIIKSTANRYDLVPCNHMKADLHTHTTCSDGTLSPSALVSLAQSRGISTLSITDHDSVQAYSELTTDDQEGMRIVPGIELSSTYKDTEIHMLGYNINTQHKELSDWCDKCKAHRVQRFYGIIDKLKGLGVALDIDEIPNNPGRLHIAQLLVQQGFVNSFQKAFKKFLADGKPAHVPKLRLATPEAIQLIVSAGGTAVLAHPGHGFSAHWVDTFIEAGMRGIECIHPMHRDRTTSTLLTFASMKGLVSTGGSDFHGSRNYDRENIGTFVMDEDMLTTALQEFGMK